MALSTIVSIPLSDLTEGQLIYNAPAEIKIHVSIPLSDLTEGQL